VGVGYLEACVGDGCVCDLRGGQKVGFKYRSLLLASERRSTAYWPIIVACPLRHLDIARAAPSTLYVCAFAYLHIYTLTPPNTFMAERLRVHVYHSHRGR